jgi:hypothetical protein
MKGASLVLFFWVEEGVNHGHVLLLRDDGRGCGGSSMGWVGVVEGSESGELVLGAEICLGTRSDGGG